MLVYCSHGNNGNENEIDFVHYKSLCLNPLGTFKMPKSGRGEKETEEEEEEEKKKKETEKEEEESGCRVRCTFPGF